MDTTLTAGTPARWSTWTGRILSALPALLLLYSLSLKLSGSPQMIESMGKHGFAPGTVFAIGLLELACLALYLIPRTAVLGAVLLTGYLGGAIATHVSAGEPFAVPLVAGGLVWAGIYLRDRRLHALLPVR
jgi:hypothetical protein